MGIEAPEMPKRQLTPEDQIRRMLPLEHFASQLELKFFLDLFMVMPTRDTSKTPLAMVSMTADKKLAMHINIPNLLKLPLKEQMYVMAHEAAHIILGHLLRCRKIGSAEVWNIATDAVINSMLNRHYRSYLSMPRNEDGKITIITLQSLEKENGVKLSELQVPENEMTSEEVYSLVLKSLPPEMIDQLDNGRIDGHDPLFNADEMDDEVKKNIEEIMRAAKNNGYGTEAGNMVQDLMKVVKKYFPFDQILDKIFDKKRSDFSRPHRRMQLDPFVLPRKRGEKIKVWAAVDVSGSCYDYIEDFVGYLLALPETEEIYFFDTDITLTLKKGQQVPKIIPGWGGTDLNPAMEKFAQIEKTAQGIKPNFVVLTDGEIPELTVGPVKSRTVIMTTSDEVHYSKAINPYININISPNKR